MAIIEEPPLPEPEWVLTYGDMMSLLLTFFVMIVSMSELKRDDKFQSVANVMEQKFGRRTHSNQINLVNTVRDELLAARADAASTARRAVFMTPVRSVHSTTASSVGTEQQQLLGMTFFVENSSALTTEAQNSLRTIFTNQQSNVMEIELRGMASSTPAARSFYRDTYDLAYERARVVARFLTEEMKFERQRIRLSCQPTSDSASERVEIVAWAQSVPAYSAARAEFLKTNSRK
jgi:chemotaxis protein MotB